MEKKRILVAYYSRSGVTRTIALTLGQMLDADVEEILDRRRPRRSVWVFAIAGRGD